MLQTAQPLDNLLAAVANAIHAVKSGNSPQQGASLHADVGFSGGGGGGNGSAVLSLAGGSQEGGQDLELGGGGAQGGQVSPALASKIKSVWATVGRMAGFMDHHEGGGGGRNDWAHGPDHPGGLSMASIATDAGAGGSTAAAGGIYQQNRDNRVAGQSAGPSLNLLKPSTLVREAYPS